MGSPLSSLLAEIVIQDIEQKVIELNEALKKPVLYNRYVDDILILWPHSIQDLELFKEQMNTT